MLVRFPLFFFVFCLFFVYLTQNKSQHVVGSYTTDYVCIYTIFKIPSVYRMYTAHDESFKIFTKSQLLTLNIRFFLCVFQRVLLHQRHADKWRILFVCLLLTRQIRKPQSSRSFSTLGLWMSSRDKVILPKRLFLSWAEKCSRCCM